MVIWSNVMRTPLDQRKSSDRSGYIMEWRLFYSTVSSKHRTLLRVNRRTEFGVLTTISPSVERRGAVNSRTLVSSSSREEGGVLALQNVILSQHNICRARPP